VISTLLRCLCALTLTFTLSLPAHANNSAIAELIEILHNKGSISAEEYQLLKNALNADQAQTLVDKADLTEQVSTVTDTTPTINTNARLSITSRDNEFSYRIGGRLHFDSYFYNNDANTDFASGTQFRRARLELENTFLKVWKIRMQYDFGGSGNLGVDGLRDAFVQYNGFNGASITIGNQKEPFGLEEYTSSNNQNYMERSLLTSAFIPSRNPGVLINGVIGETITLASGVFGEGRGNTGGGGTPGAGIDEGWSVTSRVTYSPLHTSGKVIHVGMAHSYRQSDEINAARIRSHEFGIGAGARMIDTGSFVSNDIDQIGIETGIIRGPFSASAEYVYANASVAGNDNVKFNAWYLEGNYVLTGESRGYSFASGTFNNPVPNRAVGQGGIGAWQLGLRYSAADLTDGVISGGQQQNLTFALNWYATNSLKFMANYVHVLDVNRPGHVFDNASPGVFTLRAQTYW
jgi:phosphate-selective porin OprO/OprP